MVIGFIVFTFSLSLPFLIPSVLFLCLYKVDLFAATPSNIPAESFEVYGVALALVAQAFICKKPHLIQDADNLFQQLQQTKVTAVGNSVSLYTLRENREIDFALERGLCALLVGEVDGCCSWLGLNDENSIYRVPKIVEFVMENSQDDMDDNLLPGLCKLLETWLMEVVFPKFRETIDVDFRLGDYYDDPTVLAYLERLEGVGGSPLAAAAAIGRIGAEATAVLDSVKVSAIQALQKVFPLGKGKESVSRQRDGEVSNVISTAGMEERNEPDRDLSAVVLNISEINGSNEILEQKPITNQIKDSTVKIMCAGVVAGLITLAGLRYIPFRKGSTVPPNEVGSAMASDVVSVGTI